MVIIQCPALLSHPTHRALHCSDTLQCETEHLVAITTITAHAMTTTHIKDFTIKLQGPESSVVT